MFLPDGPTSAPGLNKNPTARVVEYSFLRLLNTRFLTLYLLDVRRVTEGTFCSIRQPLHQILLLLTTIGQVLNKKTLLPFLHGELGVDNEAVQLGDLSPS